MSVKLPEEVAVVGVLELLEIVVPLNGVTVDDPEDTLTGGGKSDVPEELEELIGTVDDVEVVDGEFEVVEELDENELSEEELVGSELDVGELVVVVTGGLGVGDVVGEDLDEDELPEGGSELELVVVVTGRLELVLELELVVVVVDGDPTVVEEELDVVEEELETAVEEEELELDVVETAVLEEELETVVVDTKLGEELEVIVDDTVVEEEELEMVVVDTNVVEEELEMMVVEVEGEVVVVDEAVLELELVVPAGVNVTLQISNILRLDYIIVCSCPPRSTALRYTFSPVVNTSAYHQSPLRVKIPIQKRFPGRISPLLPRWGKHATPPSEER